MCVREGERVRDRGSDQTLELSLTIGYLTIHTHVLERKTSGVFVNIQIS